MPRTPLGHRLGLLFSSRPPSPSVSTDDIAEGFYKFGLGLSTKPSPTTYQDPQSSKAALKPQTATVHSTSPLANPLRLPASPPIVRRFGKGVDRDERPGESIADENEGETSAALQEAISDQPFEYAHSAIDIQKPPNARLTRYKSSHSIASINPSHSLKHPTLLDNLGRSTFPTSSPVDTQPPIALIRSPSPSPPVSISPFNFFSTRQAQGRTSVDSLRSLQQAHNRGLHSQKSIAHTEEILSRQQTIDSTRNSSWWFNNKKDVDPLLHPDDTAETAAEESDKIRRRCKSPHHTS